MTVAGRRRAMLEALEAAARLKRALDAPTLSVRENGEVFIPKHERERVRPQLHPRQVDLARSVLELELGRPVADDRVLRRAIVMWTESVSTASRGKAGKWDAVLRLASAIRCAGEATRESFRVQCGVLLSAMRKEP